jgi:hypothetical protein
MSGSPAGSIFRWETIKVIGPRFLAFVEPIVGLEVELELVSGSRIRAFRAEDSLFYFCHGLTFGGTDAPGGAVSPYSGKDVATILAEFYDRVHPETIAVAGDVGVWYDLDGRPIHSAILTIPVFSAGEDRLAYASVFRSKNGNKPESDVLLQMLIEDEEGYGETYAIFRRK